MGRMHTVPTRWWIVLAAIFALIGRAHAADVRPGDSSSQAPSLVFVTKSDACECQRNLCVAGEQVVINFLSGNPWGFRLEKVDLKETPEAAKELGVMAVPVVFLVDGRGRRVARFDGFFSERDLSRAWETRQSEGER